MSPLFYDLTTLQLGRPTGVLVPSEEYPRAGQAWYERHKVLTYPRTDSRAPPEGPGDGCQTLGHSRNSLFGFAGKILAEGWVRPNKRIFNNAKVSDHFAIIPTGVVPKRTQRARTEAAVTW